MKNMFTYKTRVKKLRAAPADLFFVFYHFNKMFNLLTKNNLSFLKNKHSTFALEFKVSI